MAIRQLIREGARLGEEHDIGGLIKLTTEDYEALPGNLDRRATRGFLWRAFHHYGKFRVMYPLPKVELKGDKRAASAVFPFLIVKKESALPKLQDFYENPKQWLEELGEQADLHRLQLELVKKDGKWLVKRAFLEKQ